MPTHREEAAPSTMQGRRRRSRLHPPRMKRAHRPIASRVEVGAHRANALTLATLADVVNTATRDVDICVMALPLGWHGSYRHFRHPLDYIGLEGARVGAGPGIAVGAALALKGSGRLPLAIIGDGDFLMGVTALGRPFITRCRAC